MVLNGVGQDWNGVGGLDLIAAPSWDGCSELWPEISSIFSGRNCLQRGSPAQRVNVRFLSQETEPHLHSATICNFEPLLWGGTARWLSVTLQMHPLLLQGVWRSVCQCLSMPENASPIELLCRRNPTPGPAINEDIDLLEEAQLLCLGTHLVLGGVGQTGGTATNGRGEMRDAGSDRR